MMSRRFTAPGLQLRSFLALAVLLAGCDDTSSREPLPEPPSQPASQAESAEEQVEPSFSAFSGEVTRFEEDVAEFDGLESCKSRLGAALPSALGDLLADLRYERLIDDVCTGLAAASERNVERCDELATSALQEGCRRRVALLLGDPAACATRDGDPDSSCLAWSTGRAELCAGAPSNERSVCDAVTRGDLSACEHATIPGSATCRALVARHGPREIRPAPPPLTVDYEGHVALPSGDVPLSADLTRGIVLRREACRTQVVLEGRGSPRAHLTFGDHGLPAELRYFDGQTILGVVSQVEIQDRVVETELGGRISGRVETEIELDGNGHRLTLEFETYVRNWLDPNECAAHDAARETP
ncbi:MAG: hypothetical protein AB8H86_20270 [Polyangiales bacterium]